MRELEKFINEPDKHELKDLDKILGQYRDQEFDQVKEIDIFSRFLNITE